MLLCIDIGNTNISKYGMFIKLTNNYCTRRLAWVQIYIEGN